MTGNRRIDLHQELVDVFSKEEMLAFFDFKLNLGGNDDWTSGLCRISRPKESDTASKYFSLVFIIDTPDHTLREKVDRRIDALQWDRLRSRVTEVVAVLQLPHLNTTTDLLMKEVDVYVRSIREPARLFVLRELYPAIVEVAGIKGGEVVFWDDFPDAKMPAGAKGQNGQEGRPSFFERIRDFFER